MDQLKLLKTIFEVNRNSFMWHMLSMACGRSTMRSSHQQQCCCPISSAAPHIHCFNSTRLCTYQEADEDGSGELDIDEFIEKLGPHLGSNLTEQQIRQLFMKIDADAGGTVDWCVHRSSVYMHACVCVCALGHASTSVWFTTNVPVKQQAIEQEQGFPGRRKIVAPCCRCKHTHTHTSDVMQALWHGCCSCN